MHSGVACAVTPKPSGISHADLSKHNSESDSKTGSNAVARAWNGLSSRSNARDGAAGSLRRAIVLPQEFKSRISLSCSSRISTRHLFTRLLRKRRVKLERGNGSEESLRRAQAAQRLQGRRRLRDPCAWDGPATATSVTVLDVNFCARGLPHKF